LRSSYLFFSVVASRMFLLRLLVYAAWTTLGLAKSWYFLRTNAFHQSAFTERNCLGFEDFRKRTNEIRIADAGVYTKYKIMTLWKVLYWGKYTALLLILPKNFDVIKTFTVSYICGQAFSVLSCKKSKFCFRSSDWALTSYITHFSFQMSEQIHILKLPRHKTQKFR